MLADFLKLTPAAQVKFLKTDDFSRLEKEKRIEFLKEVAASETVSSKCLACALKILRELKFRDSAFYKRFLSHPDSSVAMACKKALSDGQLDSVFGFVPMREMVKKRNNEKKLETVKLIVNETDQAGEEVLISFLAEDNLRIREVVIKELSHRPQLDEEKLVEQLAHATWSSRAAIVEILGNRRSPCLLAKAGDLANDANAEVRLKLLEALARFERDKVKSYILALTNDPHMRVSREAKRIYATI
jgi:hypothetical protein